MTAHKLSTDWTTIIDRECSDERPTRVRVSELMIRSFSHLVTGQRPSTAWFDFEYLRGEIWREVVNSNNIEKLANLYCARAASKIFDFAWEASSEEAFDDALGVLPPLQWQRGAFLMSEPMSHDYDGRELYIAHRKRDGKYYKGSRPITQCELRYEVGS